MGPFEAGAGQQPDRAADQPGVHSVPVIFDFVQPLRPVWRLADEFGELRFDPTGERRPFAPPRSGRRSCPIVKHDRPFAEIDFELAEFTGSPAA
jgi:hypothetical protein